MGIFTDGVRAQRLVRTWPFSSRPTDPVSQPWPAVGTPKIVGTVSAPKGSHRLWLRDSYVQPWHGHNRVQCAQALVLNWDMERRRGALRFSTCFYQVFLDVDRGKDQCGSMRLRVKKRTVKRGHCFHRSLTLHSEVWTEIQHLGSAEGSERWLLPLSLFQWEQRGDGRVEGSRLPKRHSAT